MAELSPRDLVRTRIEHALASEQVNLTSSAGRSRAEELIEQILRGYQAEALAGDGDASDGTARGVATRTARRPDRPRRNRRADALRPRGAGMDGQRPDPHLPRHGRTPRARPRSRRSPTTARSAHSSTGYSNRSKANGSTESHRASKRGSRTGLG